MKTYDLVVIGGGAGGLAAALEAYKEGIKSILVVEKNDKLGGILNQCIHTGFGLNEFKEELTGPEYAARFITQIKETNIECRLCTTVTKINKDYTLELTSTKGELKISFKALILSTGCYERSAGAISLPGDRVAGIVSAGQAQAYLNNFGYLPGKEVFILGSGDIGLIMARRLTLEGAHVIGVAEIMPYSNGLARNIAQCLNDFSIPLYLSTTVKSARGKGRLEEITLVSLDEKRKEIPGSEKIIKCDTLLLSVGLIPLIALAKPLGIELDNGRIAVYDNLESSFPGIFVCGNSLHVHDLVDNVSEEARNAGKEAAKYINSLEENGKIIEIKPSCDFGYIVPKHIRIENEDKNIILKFRSRNHLSNATVIIKNNGNILFKKFFPFLIPSEMDVFSFNLDHNIEGNIEIEILKK
ncbi:MAG: FAD-dependent oxidoreductase [Bacilli bacterium]